MTAGVSEDCIAAPRGSNRAARLVLIALLALFSMASAGRADDRLDPSALVGDLSSSEARVRTDAASRIAKAGSLTIERVARRSASLDAEAWRAFADAVVEQKWPPYAVALVAAAHGAPDAHRRRLLELAARLDPRAGTTVTAAELEALIRKLVIEQRGLISDHDPYECAVAIHGHAGVPIVLKLLRENGDDVVDGDRARDVLAPMAQPEDFAALRELLLAGETSVAAALRRLDALGVPGVWDAVLDAVRAGHFDVRIAVVLYGAKDRAGAARVLRESLSARERRLTDEERKWAATVFAEIGSAADVPLLETWSGSVREPGAIVETARAMMRLGNKKGVEMLVRIVEEKQEAEPPQPSAPGRLRPEGFHDGYRLVALKALDVVATHAQASGDGFNAVDPPKGPFEGDRSGTPDRVAASVRAWWDKSRDEIEFDAKAGRWIAKPK